MTAIETVIAGLADPVGLAWRDDALWIADRADRRVLRFTPALGELVAVTALVGDEPGGLAWTSTGLAITAAGSRATLEWTPEAGLQRRAALDQIASGALAGVVEHDDGGPWFVVDEGAPHHGTTSSRDAGRILIVMPDGEVGVAADELESPAGVTVTSDGSRLLVAERAGERITSFRIGAAGELSERRTFCAPPAAARAYATAPNGLAATGEGTVWCTDSIGTRLIGVAEDGSLLGEVGLDGEPTACCWAGDDENLLLVAMRPVGMVTSTRREGRVVAVALDECGFSRPSVTASARPG